MKLCILLRYYEVITQISNYLIGPTCYLIIKYLISQNALSVSTSTKVFLLQVIKVNLPNYEESTKPISELSKEEVRSRLKERGVNPPHNHIERPIFLSTTGDIFEAYVPPEGDGKVSFITKEVSCVKNSSLLKNTVFSHW